MSNHKRSRKILRDNDLINFFKPSLYTMFTRTRPNIWIRFSESAYIPIADYLQSQLDTIIKQSIHTMGKTRLIYDDISRYIDYPSTNIRQRCNSKRYGETNCYFFPKTGINRVIRQLAQQYKLDLTISEDAFIVLHMYVEQLAISLLRHSIMAMKHAKRVTLMDSDVMMAISCIS